MIGRLSPHVSPHRWADLADGRLKEEERQRLEAHAASCRRCARARAEVERTRVAMAELRGAEPPELRWDHIGARIHWITSSEQRAEARRSTGRQEALRRRRPWMLGGAGAALAAAVAGGALLLPGPEERSPRRQEAQRAAPPAQAGEAAGPVQRPEAEPLRGVVVLRQGEVRAGEQPLRLDDPIGQSAHLKTGAGRVAVQFAGGSGFALGPESSARLASFDARRVEIEVEGTIDLDLTRRPPDQRFAVIAGDRAVLVRGTAFRVDHRGGELDVACLRGRVVVTDGADEYDVAAGQRLELAFAEAIAEQVQLMSEEELAELERTLSVPVLPTWMDPKALYAASGALEISAEPGRAVRVDGVRIGEGDFALRVMSGRHHVEIEGREGQWLDLEGGAKVAARVGSRGAAKPSSARRAALRREQLETALKGSSRARRCLRRLEKLGLVEGAFIVFDVGIDPDGTQSFLNVGETNVPPEVARCLRDVVDAVEFPDGPRVRLRHRLSF